jgi:GT2 family glycosyltransferase
MKVGVVTVVTNEKGNLKAFYSSLSCQKFKNFTLYFVDNNSSDGTVEYFKLLNKDNQIDIKYIELKSNVGFAAGTNHGAEAAINDSCNFLYIVNNDVVSDENCLLELSNLVLNDKELFPGEIQEFGGKINFKKGKLKKYYENDNINNIKLPDVIETDFVSGGACFIKSDIFKKTGMYEELYFGYFDEIDFSYRLKVLNNYKMVAVSSAIAYHNHNWSKKNKNAYYFEYYLGERNKYLYFKKFKLFKSLILSVIVDLVKFPRRLFWFKKVCDFKLGFYYLKGLFHGLLNIKGKPKLKFVK